MAMTAWSANVLSRSICRSVKAANLDASDGNRADGLACADQRDGQHCPEPKVPGPVATLRVLIGFGLQVRNMNGLAVESSTCWQSPTSQGHNRDGGYRSMMGDKVEIVAVHLANCHVIGIAEAGCGRRYLCEHAFQIRRALEITRKISAVAACCSRASASSRFISSTTDRNRLRRLRMA
jgi:hypothetical protein